MTVSKDTTLCLRWNNDALKLNLSDAFQELRTDNEFFDVSLGCANGTSAKSLRAHKIILSAYSNVFKEMLRKLSTHNDPFIYLKGVSYDELSAMLDFMYYGEVYVTQSHLNSFLAVAKELQIKGLTENIKTPTSASSERKLQDVPKPVFKEEVKKSLDFNDMKARIAARNQFRAQHSILSSTKTEKIETNLQKLMKRSVSSEESQHSKNVKDYVKDPLSTMSNNQQKSNNNESFFKDLLQKQVKLEPGVRDDLIMEEGEGPDNFTLVTPGTVSENPRDFIHRMGKQTYMVKTGKKYRQLSKCRLCSKEGRDDNIKNHIKTAHPEVLNISAGSDTGFSPSKTLNNHEDSEYSALFNNAEMANTTDDGEDEESKKTEIALEDLYENLDKRVQQGKHSRRFARCKLCTKECRYDNIKSHIKSTHKDQLASIRNEFDTNEETSSYKTVDGILSELDHGNSEEVDWS